MRTVVVTGGTKRLGLAIAERLRADGWRVLTSSHRTDAGADIVADLAEPMGAARLYAAALQANGGNPPDALINNAALFTGEDAMLEQVNFVAPQKLTMLMAGRENGRGAVVNILDCRVLGRKGESGEKGGKGEKGEATFSHHLTLSPFSPYQKSKRALLDYTKKSAAMFADTLRVNAVAPGPVLAPTDVHEKAGETPLGRPTPEAVADAVAWLLSAEHTTGCVIPVDGGASVVDSACF